jgi:hypothetical protein
MNDILGRLPFDQTEPILDLYSSYLLEIKSLQVPYFCHAYGLKELLSASVLCGLKKLSKGQKR